ncbi:hypothetical protein ACFXDJ_06420 [Streptomyces sp. NPDC059443]|uniref:hypothetical protein n=1 Tax=unclassified Streptomyces TaxID=2593676 RepID=UPI0036C6B83A
MIQRMACEKYGTKTVPSRSAFYRLFQRMEGGRHTTRSARTRRSVANGPEGAFDQVTVCRSGELMEIDSTPFDVLVRLDNEAALLLARSVTPAPMRPG